MQLYPFTINGNTYSLPSFDAFAYVANLPTALGDIVQEILDVKVGTSSSSVTIGTGAKSLTTQAGLNFKAGDVIAVANTAAPQTNRMYGTVTSYNFATGALNFNVLGINGSGTFTAWAIAVGGVLSSFLSDYIIALDDGGTGYGRPTINYPGNFIGCGDPSTNMEEIYEEFAGTQGPTTAAGLNAINLPWVGFNQDTGNSFIDPTSTAVTTLLGGYFLKSAAAYNNLLPAVMYYGESGKIYLGRGALTYITKVYNVSGTKYAAQIGLSYAADGKTKDMFAGAGVGFEAKSDVNNGRYVCVCVAGNVATRINTSVVPGGTDTLRFEVDHEAKNVDFFINGAYVGTISTNIPTYGKLSALHPVYAARPFANLGLVAPTQTSFYIDSLYVRKYLLR